MSINVLSVGKSIVNNSLSSHSHYLCVRYKSNSVKDLLIRGDSIGEKVAESFKDTTTPSMNVTIKKSKHPIGSLELFDGKDKLNTLLFSLPNDAEFAEKIPEAEDRVVHIKYKSNDIKRIMLEDNFFASNFGKYIRMAKNPVMEIFSKTKSAFNVYAIKIKDNDKIILNGFYSQSPSKNSFVEKYRFLTPEGKISAYIDDFNNIFHEQKIPACVLEKLNNSVAEFVLKLRDIAVIKMFYGINVPSMTKKEIASKLNITVERVRKIIQESVAKLKYTKLSTKDAELIKQNQEKRKQSLEAYYKRLSDNGIVITND